MILGGDLFQTTKYLKVSVIWASNRVTKQCLLSKQKQLANGSTLSLIRPQTNGRTAYSQIGFENYSLFCYSTVVGLCHFNYIIRIIFIVDRYRVAHSTLRAYLQGLRCFPLKRELVAYLVVLQKR